MTEEELVKIIEPVINEGEIGWANPYDWDYGRWLAEKVAKVLLSRTSVHRAPDGTWLWNCCCKATQEARKAIRLSERWCIDTPHDTWQSAMDCATYHAANKCTRQGTP